MKAKVFKKSFALLLALLMTFMVIPQTAFTAYADEAQPDIVWGGYQNSEFNNGITNYPAITDENSAHLKWAAKHGTGWAASPTPPIIIGDCIYVAVNKNIIKLDKETGATLDISKDMIADVGYAMNPLTYGDGKLFVPIGNGMIQAIDAKTLELLWHTENIGGQTVSPVTYRNIGGKGYVFTGTFRGESSDGSYVCAATDDLDITVTESGDKVKALKWRFTPSTDDAGLKENANAKRGFYWAGCLATDKYIAVGSDDGTSEGDYTANAVFYTLDPLTGKVIDRIGNIAGDIRSSAVYDDGHIYFTTKGGVLGRVAVDANGDLGDLSTMPLNGMATASPVVYKGRAYIGVAGKAQFTAGAGHCFRVVDVSKPLDKNSNIYDMPTKGYPQAAALLSTSEEAKTGKVYIYFTYNSEPGGIYFFSDSKNQTKPSGQAELFVPPTALQQYCISPLCMDREGVFYYKNDSCNIMAVEPNMAYITTLEASVDAGELSWNKPFRPDTTQYELRAGAATKEITFRLTLAKGASAKVNDAPYDGNQAKIVLNADKPETNVKIEVVNGAQNRTYSLKVIKAGANANLKSIKINNSNGYNGFMYEADSFTDPDNNYETPILGEPSFVGIYNIWPKTEDEHATIKIYPLQNFNEEKTGFLSSDGKTLEAISGWGGTRYPFYVKDKNKDSKIKIVITSEDESVIKEYFFTLAREIHVASVELNKLELSLNVGQSEKLVETVSPDTASNKDVTWSVEEGDAAKVEQDGTVTGLKPGTCKVKVTTADGSHTATCTVNVKEKTPLANYNVRFDVKDNEGQAVTNPKINVTYESTYEDEWGDDVTTTETLQPQTDGSYKMSKYHEYTYAISADGHESVTGKIKPSGDEENITKEVTLNKLSQDLAKVNAVKKAFDEKVRNLKPKYGKDENILPLAKAVFDSLTNVDKDGVTIEFATSENEKRIAEDGSIAYVNEALSSYGMNSANVGVTFNIKCGAESATTKKVTAMVGWDVDHYNSKMQEEKEALAIPALLAEGDSVNAVTKDLRLPQIMTSSARSAWSVISWESSKPEIISVEENGMGLPSPKKGKITVPEKDTEVTLTATFAVNDININTNIESASDFGTYTKSFKVTVKGNEVPKPTEAELLEILNKYYTVDGLTVFGSKPEVKIDPSNVTSDIQLIRYTRIKGEDGKPVFKNREISVTSSDPKIISISGYRANVDRFQTEDKTVNLTVSFTREGITVTKGIPLTVNAITEAELDAEIIAMDKAKAAFFDGLNDGRYADKDNVDGDLHAFQEMSIDGEGNIIWAYNHDDIKGYGIIPDSFFEDSVEMETNGYNKFRSSDPKTIKHDNLVVKRNTSDTEVTITALLSSELYGSYAPSHKDNAKLQKLYKQEVSATVTVLGTKAPTEVLEQEISSAKALLDKIVEGTEPGEYAEGTKTALSQAIAAAEAVKAQPELTKEEVNKAVGALKAAIRAAEEKINPEQALVTATLQLGKNAFDYAYTLNAVKANESLKAGYVKSDAYRNKVTVIDVLVSLHREIFGEDFDNNPTAYLVMNEKGWLSKVFGVETYNIGYFVNDKMPKYPDDPNKGSVANDTVMTSGDHFAIWIYQSSTYSDKYIYFTEKKLAAKAGEDVETEVMGFYAMMDPTPVPQKDCKVVVKSGDEVVCEATTNEAGKAVFTAPAAGSYTVTVASIPEDPAWGDIFIAPYAALSVDKNSLVDAKNTAIAELESYKDPSLYRDEQKAELAEALKAGKAEIEKASDEAGVAEALSHAKANMDAVKTDAQLSEEEEAERVKALIAALPTGENVHVSDKEKIEEARKAYDALSPEQKAMVGDIGTLTDSEEEHKHITESPVLDMAPESGLNSDNDVSLEDGELIFTKGTSKGASFRSPAADFDLFTGVSVDGMMLTRGKEYEIAKGSIIVNFAKEYLESLTAGVHEVRIDTERGYAIGKIKIAEAKGSVIVNPGENANPSEKPAVKPEAKPETKPAAANTGDSNQLMYWLVMVMIVSMMMAAMHVARKRRNR